MSWKVFKGGHISINLFYSYLVWTNRESFPERIACNSWAPTKVGFLQENIHCDMCHNWKRIKC